MSGAELVAVQLPFSDAVWAAIGGPSGDSEVMLANGVGLRRGPVRAWAWRGRAPRCGVPACEAVRPGAKRVALGIDHAVLISPDVAAFGAEAPGQLRKEAVVQGRRRAFYLCGTAVLEVLEQQSAQKAKLFGICLDAEDPEALAHEWERRGLDVSHVHPAVQDGARHIFNLRKQKYGLAVITRRKTKSNL